MSKTSQFVRAAVPALAFLLLISSLGAQQSLAPATYKLKATPATVVQGYYDASITPVLRIHSGDTVDIDTLSSFTPERLEAMGVPPGEVLQTLRDFYSQNKGGRGHILTGPVYVEGAAPGDVLEVRILAIRPSMPYAYNNFGPGGGSIPEDFPYARDKLIPLDTERMVANFAPGIVIPLHPFFGNLGVQPPPQSGRQSSGPPAMYGGNMDDRKMVAGTTLFFPVFNPGALFVAGDGHAGQGDGELDGSAMETSLSGTFQFIVRKDMHLNWPRLETSTSYMTMGFDTDLGQATKMAIREMIDFLVTQKHLSRDDAYALCSAAVDLSVGENVDGKKSMDAVIPKAIFVVH